MEIGTQVRRRTTGEHGVVVDSGSVGVNGQFVHVALPSGRVLVHTDELVSVPSDPLEALLAGHVGDATHFDLHVRALYLEHAYQFDPRSGLSNARVEPQPHQVFVAHRVTDKLRPRMILADEVGLGKTIEAGLIIKELIARRLIERILVVCPASLTAQWRQEMRRRFNLDFAVLDGDGLRYLSKDGSNPWNKETKVITSLALAARPSHAERVVEAGWDMVIFDEAHRVRRTMERPGKYRTTQAYELADELKEDAFGMLLLTATPVQLHHYELYALLELVEPGLHGSFDQYSERRTELPRLSDAMRLLHDWNGLTKAEREPRLRQHWPFLRQVAGEHGDRDVERLDDAAVRESLMAGLLERHPLAGAMVRNRKAEVGGFMKRHPHHWDVHQTEAEREAYIAVTEYIRYGYGLAQARGNLAFGFLMVTYQKMLTSSSQAIRTSLGKRVQKLRSLRDGSPKPRRVRAVGLEVPDDPLELSDAVDPLVGIHWDTLGVQSEIATLESLIAQLGRLSDSKADVLVNDILDPIWRNSPDEKVLLFTQFVETQHYLESILSRFGIKVALFNGSLNAVEKEAQILRFRREVPIMISTEAGGEGRNLQFAHIVINYDLPWNPMRVEQRIGRVDRIGQTMDVEIHNLAYVDTIEARVLEVLERRIRLFEESVGSLDPILEDVEARIESLISGDQRSVAEFATWSENLERSVVRARESELRIQDFVMDQGSLRRDRASELLNKPPLATADDLRQFVGDVLRYFGGTLQPHSDGGDEVACSPRLASQLGLRTPVQRGTFDPELACTREDLEFFAFGHALVDALVALPHVDAPVASVVGISELHQPVALEIHYRVSGEGLRRWGRIVRHRVGADCQVDSTDTTRPPATLPYSDNPPTPQWLSSAATASQSQIRLELGHERERLTALNDELRGQEVGRANRIASYRRTRLRGRIEDQASRIAEKEGSGSERERRILPALRGKLARLREDLERLEFDLDKELGRIADRGLTVDATVLSAAIVLPA